VRARSAGVSDYRCDQRGNAKNDCRNCDRKQEATVVLPLRPLGWSELDTAAPLDGGCWLGLVGTRAVGSTTPVGAGGFEIAGGFSGVAGGIGHGSIVAREAVRGPRAARLQT